MNIADKLNALRDRTNYLMRLQQQFPDVKLDGHYKYSPSVNAIAEYVDIVMHGPYPAALPYVLFEDEPIFSNPFTFYLTTDEGYEIEWRQDMQAAGINTIIITKVEQAQRTRNGKEHYDTRQSRDFQADCAYGNRRFGY